MYTHTRKLFRQTHKCFRVWPTVAAIEQPGVPTLEAAIRFSIPVGSDSFGQGDSSLRHLDISTVGPRAGYVGAAAGCQQLAPMTWTQIFLSSPVLHMPWLRGSSNKWIIIIRISSFWISNIFSPLGIFLSEMIRITRWYYHYGCVEHRFSPWSTTGLATRTTPCRHGSTVSQWTS